MLDISKDKKNFYEISDKVKTDSGNIYEIGDYLGSGGNAVVYEAFDFENKEYAIKFNLNLGEKNITRFKQEIRVLQNISHPHLLKYIDEGSIVAKNRNEDVQIPFMIMEKADLNLRDYLKKKGRLDYSEYMSQFCGLSEALSKLVVHRDIKLENILIIGEKWVLSDLGLCSFLSEEEHEDITGMNEKVGPKYWMSPEAINRMYDVNQKIIPASDVFQLASVFWFVINGKYPQGIVCEEDWSNKRDMETCKLLLKSLSFNAVKRPQNGTEFFNEFQKIRNYYENKKI